ncbi:hypothetical protein HYS47_03270 [Candidatus Woesearchaeota archaeon]|nr:hypothetical protein [Candidatus Woesearchaeota archaeon]
MTERIPELEVLDLLGKDHRKVYQTVESSFASTKRSSYSSKDELKDDVFQSLKTVKVDSIKGVIEDIEDLIKKRDDLTSQISKKIEKMLNTFNNLELQLSATSNDDASLKHDLLNLKTKQIELERFMIEEEVENWKDIAKLKNELRERVKEFKEKESRLDMLDKILTQ